MDSDAKLIELLPTMIADSLGQSLPATDERPDAEFASILDDACGDVYLSELAKLN